MVEKAFFLKHFGKEIRQRRQDKELTMETLAELAGISVNYLGDIEHGKSEPKAYNYTRICMELDINPILLYNRILEKYQTSLKNQ